MTDEEILRKANEIFIERIRTYNREARINGILRRTHTLILKEKRGWFVLKVGWSDQWDLGVYEVDEVIE